MQPLIITVAGVGAELSKKDTPYLPDTPQKIIQEAIAVSKAGAHVFHLHARDIKGRPTLDTIILRQIIHGIRKEADIFIQVSTGGDIRDTFQKRLKVLDCPVDMGSLTLGSVNFGGDVFLNPVPLIEKLALKMQKKNIRPELEIFDTGMVEQAHKLLHQGFITPPLHFNIILGGPGWLPATVENLEFILKKLPVGSTWSASGVGKGQLPMIEHAIAHGGHVRTGLEDNIYLSKGVLAKGNLDSVYQVIELAKKHNRPLASMEQARKILNDS